MKSLLDEPKIRVPFWIGLVLVFFVPGFYKGKNLFCVISELLYFAFVIVLFVIILKERGKEVKQGNLKTSNNEDRLKGII